MKKSKELFYIEKHFLLFFWLKFYNCKNLQKWNEKQTFCWTRMDDWESESLSSIWHCFLWLR
jgi:hypothetical protein